MSLLEIVTLPDPILRRKAKKVTLFDKEFQNLVINMLETMRQAPGVGLAAPQIGESIRLVVIEYSENEEDENAPKRVYVLANPEIVQASEEKVLGVEACLSIPGLVGEVERHEAIIVKSLNRYGKPTKTKVKGWLARIFQHEIDHLDGVVFTDRATRVWEPKDNEEIINAD